MFSLCLITSLSELFTWVKESMVSLFFYFVALVDGYFALLAAVLPDKDFTIDTDMTLYIQYMNSWVDMNTLFTCVEAYLGFVSIFILVKIVMKCIPTVG